LTLQEASSLMNGRSVLDDVLRNLMWKKGSLEYQISPTARKA
jgi:hypothetical protein